MLERLLGEREQQSVLSANALEVPDQLALDPVLGARADLVHHLDQQVHERVGDLRRARPAEHRQQRQPDRLLHRAQIRRVRGRGPRAPRGDQLLRTVGEQVSRQLERADALELGDLLKDRVQPRPARVALELREKPILRCRDQLLEPVDRARRQPLDEPLGEPALKQRAARCEDPLDPGGSGRLDPLPAQAREQIVTQTIL
jgi:hypothetical protein